MADSILPVDPFALKTQEPVELIPTPSPLFPGIDASIPVAPAIPDTSKKAQLEQMSQAKKLLLGGSSNADVTAAAVEGGNNLASRNQVILDAKSLTPLEFQRKYGADADTVQNRLTTASDRYNANVNQSRDAGQIVGDAANSVVQGAVGSAGGIVALGAGLVNDRAGNAIADALGGFSEGMSNLQSDELNRARRVDALAAELDSADNKEQYERDVATDGSSIAGLKRIGRDFGDVVERAISSPAIAGDLVAQGIGSLVVAGPTGKAVKAVGGGLKGILGEVGKEVIERSSMPIAIGAMEGGGAFSQASQEVLNMTHEELRNSSPFYNEQIAAGVSPEDAKQAVANRSGLIAGAIQAPIGALTGTLVSKIEANPFRVPSLGSVPGAVTREVIEETIQSGAGEAAVGTGVNLAADENRDVLDNVGASAASGGIGAAGSTGVVQAPGAILRGASDAVKAAVGTVLERGEKVDQANAAASPAAKEVIRGSIDQAVEQVPAIAQGLQSVAKVETPEAQTELNDYIGRVARTAQITPEEIAALPENIRAVVPDSDNRFDTILSVAEIAANPEANFNDRVDAGLFVRQQLRNNEAVFNADLPSALKGLSEDSQELQQLRQYQAILDSIRQDPDIREVFNVLDKIDSLPEAETITPDVVSRSVNMAEFNPIAVNPATNDRILLHADRGDITITPEQRKSLQTSSTLVRATQQYADDLAEMGQPLGTDSMRAVNEQIERKSNDPNKLSLAQHLSGIIQAKQSGDETLARDRAVRLGLFARHMRNKVDALNKSFTSGKGQTYQAIDPNGKWFTSKEELLVRPKSQGSVNFAQQIYAEAKYAATMANNIAETFPELGLRSIDLPSLVPQLRKPVSQEEQQVKATRKVPENRTQEADKRVVEAPVENDTVEVRDVVPEAPVVEATTNSQEVESEPTPVVSEVREEAKPEAREESQESVQREEQEEAEAIRDTTGTEADGQTEPVTVESAYPRLVKIKNAVNRFVQAFKFPKQMNSRLVGQESPLNYLHDLLKSESTLTEVTGQLPYTFTKELSRKYREYVSFSPAIVQTMNERFHAALTKQFTEKKSGRKYTDRSSMEDGFDVIARSRGRAFAILDDDFNYNPELLQSAVAAGLHWALNAERTVYKLDDERIAKIVGISETEVDDDMRLAFGRGLSVIEAKRGLAEQITKFWGVQADKNAPDGYVKGIPEAIAAEILYGLEDTGVLKLDQDVEFNDKPYPRVLFDQRPEEIQQLFEKLEIAPTVIADAALIEHEDVLHIGQPPKGVAQTQMRNPLVQNTKQQKAAIKKANSIPYYPNTMMLDFLRSMGEQSVVQFFGGQDLEGKVFNKNHRKSVEGRNRGLTNAYRNIMRQVARINNYAGTNAFAETPTYYEHNMSRVGRLHMQGSSNPQADKMARESFMSTRTRLDMTNDADIQKFWMTVAQAIGKKTEKLTRADAVAEAQKFIGESEHFMPAVRAFVQDGSPLSQETLDAIRAKLGNDLSFKAMHALLAVAKLDSTPADQLGSFEHFLSLEADGKTDGPINALVHFTAGDFTPDWLRNVAKGGLFFGTKGKTLNAHQAVDKKDLYEDAKDKLVEKQADFRALLAATSPEASELSNALLRIMDKLDTNITFDNGELKLARGVTKNPLTITIYGSGVKGIAGKVAKALIDTFYEKISEEFQGKGSISDELLNDLQSLINNSVTKNWETGIHEVKNVGNLKLHDQDAAELTIGSKQMEIFRDNVKTLFVNQMDGAIREMMGPSMDVTRSVQRAIQVQSIALKHIFQSEVRKRLKASGRRLNEFLTQNELAEIYKDLARYSPLIETGTQTFFVGGAERADFIDTEFSTSVSEDLSSPAFLFGPVNAGVGGAPYMVIGTGDGQMIQNLLTVKNSPEGILVVFDGVEMPASSIDEASQIINEAVFDGWMRNPVRSVSDSFKNFLATDPFSVLEGKEQGAMMEEVLQALYGPTAAGMTFEDGQAEVSALNDNLINHADQIQARHETMEAVELSVDHMASAESPYSNEGEVLPQNEAALLKRINEIYGEKLAKIQKVKVTKPVMVTTEGLNDSDTGVKVIGANDLIAKLPKSPLTDAIYASLPEFGGYRVVLGSSEQIAAYEQNNDPENYDPTKPFFGKINVSKKLIYISNPTQETILHELIHAATFDKVANFYENPSVLSEQDAEAIQRLEGLMNEWRELSFEEDNAPAREARTHALAEVEGRLNKGQKAEALNEFMAWSLSNQHLINAGKKTKVKNPILRIVGKALEALKRLVGMGVDDTLFSNIRFNTQVLLSTPSTLKSSAAAIMFHQGQTFGSDQRLLDLRERFFNKIIATIDESAEPQVKAAQGQATRAAMAEAQTVAGEFLSRGFSMNMQQSSTFQMIHAALATEAELNPASLARIQDIYASVTKKLTVEDFMNDPNSQDPNERFNAQEKFNVLNGVYLTKTDKQGRSNLLPAFLALAMVDDGFRSILNEMEVPKSERNSDGTLDAVLDNVVNEALDGLSTYMSGEGRNAPNVRAALDSLTETMIERTGDQRSFIEQFSEKTVTGFEQWFTDQLQNLSGKVTEKSRDVLQNSNSKLARAAANVGIVMSSIVNNETAEHVASAVTTAMNNMNVWTPLRELTTEIIGRTKENASVFDMISLVRSAVQQTRQQFREHLPGKIAKHFSRPVTDEEWTHLFKGLGKTDLASLQNSYDLDTIRDMLVNNSAISVLTAQIEAELQVSEGPLFKDIKRKAQELATFMNTGKASGNLLRNAYAVANLFGAGGRKTAASEQTIQKIDHLITLYSLKGLDQDVKNTLKLLAETEQDGIDFALSYLVGQRADEQAKVKTSAARANHYKGYIPSENQIGTSLIVAEDTEYARLVTLGYTRVADYVGSQAEGRGTKRGYYHAPVSGRAAFNQGVLQTVKTTVSGVDPQTGTTVMDLTAGAIMDPDEVKRITRNMGRNGNVVEPLLPVYDDAGDVIAYERSIDPVQMARMNRNTHLGQMIGAWRGRQVEEALATDFNKQLIDNLAKIWNDQKGTRKNEFVDLSNLRRTDDPVLHDAWSLIPRELRDYIQGVFGGEGFPVRLDMINDAIGFRSASVGDAWTGNTRWKPAVTEKFRHAAMGVFGNKAFNYMVQAEKFTQNVVGDMRVLIVVKSVIVPVANILSNMYQLSARGVPVRNIIQGMSSKTTEVNQYIKNRDRQIELEADLRAAGSDPRKIRKIETELQSIKDANKRMSIAPLIEHGEFSSISDGGVTQEDLALSEGKFIDYLERTVSKLPAGIRTAGRYAFVTKDTALFKGLARSVQYGDFLAKAVMYEDLIKRKKLSKEEALAQVSEEFINYNRLAGRSRNYLESVGLLWFWNFKLRSMKVAASMVRNNPVRALLSAVAAPNLPVIGAIGSPVTDNFLSVMADGKLDYSVGPGMGLNSWNLNPWMNLFK